jgi:hypothetical protein
MLVLGVTGFALMTLTAADRVSENIIVSSFSSTVQSTTHTSSKCSDNSGWWLVLRP